MSLHSTVGSDSSEVYCTRTPSEGAMTQIEKRASNLRTIREATTGAVLGLRLKLRAVGARRQTPEIRAVAVVLTRGRDVHFVRWEVAGHEATALVAAG